MNKTGKLSPTNCVVEKIIEAFKGKYNLIRVWIYTSQMDKYLKEILETFVLQKNSFLL